MPQTPNAQSSIVRIAALQYLIRPIDTFEQFRDQVSAQVDIARDYRCQMLVFPEYFTIQLITLEEIDREPRKQVRTLAKQAPRFIEMMAQLARDSGLYIVAGTVPILDENDPDIVYNRCHVFGPDGNHVAQDKLHMTRWENEDWGVAGGNGVTLIETSFGKIAVAICYDSEFPEIARAAAREGCYILVVPSCTDDRQGFLRVRYCCHARAIENTMYVIHAGTVGSLPMVPAVSMNYGQASILTPSDFPFARDGILAEGNTNQEQLVIGEINLDTIRQARENGTVLPLRDSVTTAQVTRDLNTVKL